VDEIFAWVFIQLIGQESCQWSKLRTTVLLRETWLAVDPGAFSAFDYVGCTVRDAWPRETRKPSEWYGIGSERSQLEACVGVPSRDDRRGS
jgi:hypothetical protein